MMGLSKAKAASGFLDHRKPAFCRRSAAYDSFCGYPQLALWATVCRCSAARMKRGCNTS